MNFIYSSLASYGWSVICWLAGTNMAKNTFLNFAQALAERTDNSVDDILISKLRLHICGVDDQGKSIVNPEEVALLLIETKALYLLTNQKNKYCPYPKELLEKRAEKKYKKAKFILLNLADITDLTDLSSDLETKIVQILNEKVIGLGYLRDNEETPFITWVFNQKKE